MKTFFCFIFIAIFSFNLFAQQTVQDFYLSNYEETGKNKWEVTGVEAVVSDEKVDIDKMKGTYFQEDDTIKVESDKAKLNKATMDVELEKNVVVNNTQGVKLKTDELNWKRQENKVFTDKPVEVTKTDTKSFDQQLKVTAQGMQADTKMSKLNFEKDVKVGIKQEESNDPINIDCDGPLEIDYEQGVAVFNNNVVVDSEKGKILSKNATVFFDQKDNTIVKIIAEGDVKIIRDENVTFAERAVYYEKDKKIILEGRPRLVLFPEENSDFLWGKGKDDENTGN